MGPIRFVKQGRQSSIGRLAIYEPSRDFSATATVRYLGVDVEDALALAENTEIGTFGSSLRIGSQFLKARENAAYRNPRRQ